MPLRRRRIAAPSLRRRLGIALTALAVLVSTVAAPGALAQTPTDPGAAGTLTWFAADEAGGVVAQTTYALEGPGGKRTVADNGALDANTTTGTITLGDVPVGGYTITQVGTPSGHQPDGEPRRVVVTENGQEPALPITFVNAIEATAGAIPRGEGRARRGDGRWRR